MNPPENKMWVDCPFCLRKYLAIRKDGKVFIRKHYRRISRTTPLGISIIPGKRVICPGSQQEIVERLK